MFKRQLYLGLATLLLAGLTAPAASPTVPLPVQRTLAPPPTLTGEVLHSSSAAAGNVIVFNITCLDDTAVLTYAVSGIARGPYPGMFAEMGTVRLHQIDDFPADYEVTDFSASFSIQSGTSLITGTKRLDPVSSGSIGSLCNSINPFLNPRVFIDARYVATVQTPGGRFRDEGKTNLAVGMVVRTIDPLTLFRRFEEKFTSSLPATRLL